MGQLIGPKLASFSTAEGAVLDGILSELVLLSQIPLTEDQERLYIPNVTLLAIKCFS